jgi:hypothetical protein
MTEYTISITDSVFESVYRLTANAAVQRGDAQAVATEDNKDMLQQFKDEGFKLLEKAFGRYYVGGGKYSMPSNWPDLSTDINTLAEKAITNYILAKWYELNGAGESFHKIVNETIDIIALILGKRVKSTNYGGK